MIRAIGLEATYRTVFANGSSESVADIPIEKGGEGRGFGPHELLEAALATCMAITVQKFAHEHSIPLSGVECSVSIDRSDSDAIALDYTFVFHGPVSEEQSARLRGAAALCPVGKTLTGNIVLRNSEGVR